MLKQGLLFSPKILLQLFLLLLVTSLATSQSYGAAKADTKTPLITVSVQGIPDPLLQQIRQDIPLIGYQKYLATHPQQLEIIFARSIRAIKNLLEPYGYYHVKVSAKLDEVATEHWQANFSVTLGPPMVIQTLNLSLTGSGKSNTLLNQTLHHAPFQIGSRLIQPDYTNLKDTLLNQAIAQGYLDAHYSTHQLRIDPAGNKAHVVLTLNTGQQYTFGQTHFEVESSKEIFASDFLKRFIPQQAQTHQPYLLSSIQAFQQNLNDNRYFASSLIVPKPDKDKHTVNLEAHITPLKAQAYTLGIGYGTETKVRGLVGWKLRHLGRYGQQFSAQLQVSQLYQTFTLAYTFPGENPLTDHFTISAGQGFKQVSPYNSTETIVGFEKTQQRNDWTVNFGIQEHFFQYTPSGKDDESAYYLIPYLNLTYLDQESYGYFQRGYMLLLSTQGALRNLLSTSSYLKELINYRQSWPLSLSTVFFIDTELGAIQTNDYTDLALPLRYFAGGIGTVRGYSYMSLSPNNVGGHYLFAHSFNLEQHLFSDLSGILFYDIGNVFDNLNALSLAQGAGVGLSWKTPIGPIQLYFARPIASTQHSWQINLSLGAIL